jgi:two-component system response regulator
MLEAVKDAGLENVANVEYATDGIEALRLLAEAYREGKAFVVVLLDLNMPKMTGQEVLKAIKGNNHYKDVSVFILTNSDNMRDMEECRKLGADAFIQKPTEFKRLVDLFAALKESLAKEGQVVARDVNTRYEEMK